MAVLMCDPQAAFGAVIHDRVAGGGIYAGYIDYLRAGHRPPASRPSSCRTARARAPTR